MSFSKAQWFGIGASGLVLAVLMILPTQQKAEDASPEISTLTAKIDSAVSLVEGDNPMAGIMMLREVLQEDPNNVEALMRMGVFSMQSGQFDKAIGRFESVLKQNANMEAALFYAAQTQVELGKREEAKKYFEQFLEISTDEKLKDEVRELIQQF